jgi:acetyl-CoA acetyltransferase
MRNVDGQRAAEHLGSAAWAGREAVAAKFPWPALFADVASVYDKRYGLDPEHLGQYERAGVAGPDALDVVELHDCFTITGLVALEHLGAAPPGDGGKFIADGGLDTAGINPGGGLLGLGHPVGATGVRMLHDVARQVTGTAGETQVAGARTALTLNVGGSFTTVVTMIVQASA